MGFYNNISRYLIYPIAELAMGTNIIKNYNFLEKSQWWSKSKIVKYQTTKLKQLINHAYDKVPFYRKLWEKREISPNDFNSLDDLQKFPVINKTDIKSNFEDFKSKDFHSYNPKLDSTGGSTGDPLQYYHDWNAWSMGWACAYRGWSYAGYRIGDKIVTLGGSSIVKGQKPSFKKMFKDRIIERHKGISAFDMNDESLATYVKEINSFSPKFLRGYPSALHFLSKYVKKNNLSFPNLKAIFTTAETLLPHYREAIESNFSVPVFDGYGMNDGGANANECEHKSGLHVSPERSVLEFLPIKNSDMNKIIVTDLHNFSFPFIRYDVGDVGILSESNCKCGRNSPIIKNLEGRLGDLITFSDGTTWSPPVLTLVFAKFDIVNYQILQKDVKEIFIKIVKGSRYDNSDDKKIREIFLSHMNSKDNLNIEYVSSITASKSGKRRFIISEIKR